jgi:predicted TIM-barrel fold metal-dependent hydrolase
VTDREAWLGLTSETAIEPEIPICDPHHHIWDYPGSRYLVDEFLQDIGGGHRIQKTVFVECRQFYLEDGPEEMRSLGETRFVDSLAGPARIPGDVCDVAAGIVAYANLCIGSAVQEVLDAHMEASRRFRGVRHASAWDENEGIHNAHTNPPPGLLGDARFREGLACLERRGLSFDAWLYHPQIPELVDLARAFPGMSIILNHMAGPLGIGPYAGHREEVFAIWKAHMAALADCENVSVKLGGLTMSMSGFGWHKREVPAGSSELAEAMAPYYHSCIEQFGANRCMFESNFPVDRASCSYTVQWNAFKRLSHGYTPAERSSLFRDTASRVYRLAG